MSLFKNLTSIFYWVIVAQILGHQVDRVFLNLSSVSSCHLMWGSYSSCALTSAQVTARTSRWPLPFPASSLQTTHLRHTLLPPPLQKTGMLEGRCHISLSSEYPLTCLHKNIQLPHRLWCHMNVNFCSKLDLFGNIIFFKYNPWIIAITRE